MTSWERIQATLTGRSVDRRAVAPVLCLYGARLTGCPLERYYTDPEAYARGQTAVYETFQPDILFAPFDYASLGAAFGGEARYFSEQPPNLKRFALASADEWDRLSIPDPDRHPVPQFLRRAVRSMAAEHGGRVPIAAPLVAPIDLPSLILGPDGWLELLLFDPERARRVVESLTPFFVGLANGLFADGVALLVLPCAFASPQVVPRDLVARLTLPALASVLGQLKGPVAIHHGGAPLLPYLDLLAGLPAVAFALDPRDDLASGRRLVGSERVLLTGPMAPELPGLSSEEVERRSLAVLDERAQDPRFLLCTAGPDVPWHTPPDNIHALRRATEIAGAPCR